MKESLKNPHAVALGRSGGLANTEAQREARARVAAQNGAKGGRPRKRTPAELKRHRRQIARKARKVNRRKK